jgi:ATP:ADP antiporter, AAA family
VAIGPRPWSAARHRGPPEAAVSSPRPRGSLDRFLSLFADVRPGETRQLVLLTLTVFLILAAYYIMKPAREALILAQPRGAEIKSYTLGAQALLLTLAVPLYGVLATRMARRWLINLVTLFFIACLPVFYVLAENGYPVGIVFFLWIGIFSLMVIAQFWAFANDVYTPEAGKRLFALIAFGASSGAVFGAFICGRLIRLIGVHALLLLAAVVLAASLAVFNLVERRALRSAASGGPAADADRPIGEGNPFGLVLQHRYLMLIATLILLLNWVNANGEYILGSVVRSTGEEQIASGQLRAEERSAFIGHFYASYFQVVNITGMLLQLFLVSRAINYSGVPVSMTILPLVALVSYGVAALVPSLGILRWVKTAENSIDYSLQNTVSQVLYLPTTRAQKYKAKQVIDTFVVRSGDLLAAGTVLVGTSALAFGASRFAMINVVLVLAWLVLAVAVGREFVRRVPARRPAMRLALGRRRGP